MVHAYYVGIRYQTDSVAGKLVSAPYTFKTSLDGILIDVNTQTITCHP